jgi:tetratricopeptide (TPR) repeat protein
MNYQSLLDRILATVDDQAYLSSTSHVDDRNRAGMQQVEAAIQDKAVSAESARALCHRLYRDGKIDQVSLLSGLHAIAASPTVMDYAEAARLAGEQELAALDLGGPNLNANLACVDRHRGVLAYVRGHYDVALDYFTRSFERQRNAMNLQNVLCTLLRIGEHSEALDLMNQVRRAFPDDMVHKLDTFIASDPDLAVLRTEIHTS